MKVKIDMRGLIRRFSNAARMMDERVDTLLEPVGFLLENQTRRRIRKDKSSPSGRPWKPWSKAYASFQRRNYPNRRMLEATGALRDSIQYKTDAGKKAATAGTNIKYAKHVNKQRQFVGLSSADKKEIKGLIALILQRDLFTGGA